jgi:hypothetical protein
MKTDRKWMALVIGFTLMAAILFVPIVPMKDVGSTLVTLSPASPEGISPSAAQDNSSVAYCEGFPVGSAPPPGCEVVSDPSGTYYFRYIGNDTYETDLATYESMLQDPYSGIGGTIHIVNDTVYIIMQQSNITSGGTYGIPSSLNSVGLAPDVWYLLTVVEWIAAPLVLGFLLFLVWEHGGKRGKLT